MLVLVFDLLNAFIPLVLPHSFQLGLGGLEGSMTGHLGLRVGKFVYMKLILTKLLVIVERIQAHSFIKLLLHWLAISAPIKINLSHPKEHCTHIRHEMQVLHL